MITGRTKVFVGISMLLIAVIACQAPFLPPPTFTPRPPSELTTISQLETQTAQSSAVSTTSVLSPIPPDAVASQEPASPSGVSQPVEASATAVPSSSTLQPVEATLTSAAPVGVAHPVEATATSYIPPTDTASPLPVIPMASVGSNTECRTGPSQFYKLVLRVGVGNKF